MHAHKHATAVGAKDAARSLEGSRLVARFELEAGRLAEDALEQRDAAVRGLVGYEDVPHARVNLALAWEQVACPLRARLS